MTIVNETTFSVFFAKSISPLTDESLLADRCYRRKSSRRTKTAVKRVLTVTMENSQPRVEFSISEFMLRTYVVQTM